MIQPKELQKLGERISKDFLDREIPLTQGLEKVAQENGLNKNQIDRVAEAANVKTHLQFLKTAQNEAYINFDVADPKKVKAPARVKEATLLEDYYKPPFKDNEDFLKEASFYEIKEEKKEKSSTELFKEAQVRREKVERLSNEVSDLAAKMENKENPLYSLVKQAALGGTPVEHLQVAVDKGAGEYLGEYYIEKLAQRLEKDNIDFEVKDLSKYASKRINEDNKIFKTSKQLGDVSRECLQKIASLEEAIDNLGDHLIEKQAKAKGLLPWIGSGIHGFFSFAKDHPVIAMGATAGTAGTLYGANRLAKKRTKLENQKIEGRKRSRAY